MAIQIVRLFEAGPEFLDLTREAEAESPAPRDVIADAEDATVFAAIVDGDWAGLGALRSTGACPRICNLFVRRAFRRSGVGRALAGALTQEGLHAAERVELTADTEDAALFWEAVGFRRVSAHAFETTRA